MSDDRGPALSADDAPVWLRMEADPDASILVRPLAATEATAVEASVERPDKELKGFAKVRLQPGEATSVTFTLGKDAISFYDEANGAWVAEPGKFEVLVGASSRDIRLAAAFTLA